MKKIISFFIKELLYNGHLQSLGAAGIAYVSAILLDGPLQLVSLLNIYLLFQVIYINDRYECLEEDAITNPVRAAHLKSYVQFIPRIFALFTIATLALLFLLSHPAGIIFSIFVVIMGLLYPFYFKNLTRIVPLFKNFYVASVFALMVFYPYLYSGVPPISFFPVILCFLFVFLQGMIMQGQLDFKDIESDRKEALRTLPLVLGERAAWYVLIISVIIITVVFSFAAARYDIEERGLLYAEIFVTAIWNILVFYWIREHNPYAYLMSAAKFLLWPITLFSFFLIT